MSNLSDYIRNATIPANSNILPASAYYAATKAMTEGGWTSFANLGLTDLVIPPTLTTAMANYIVYSVALFTGLPVNMDFTGNALSVASVDSILFSCANALQWALLNVPGGILGGGTIDLSGGTNASPTGGTGNADYMYLNSHGATVIIN